MDGPTNSQLGLAAPHKWSNRYLVGDLSPHPSPGVSFPNDLGISLTVRGLHVGSARARGVCVCVCVCRRGQRPVPSARVGVAHPLIHRHTCPPVSCRACACAVPRHARAQVCRAQAPPPRADAESLADARLVVTGRPRRRRGHSPGRLCTGLAPFNFAWWRSLRVFASPHVRTAGCTCGEASKIKKCPHRLYFTLRLNCFHRSPSELCGTQTQTQTRRAVRAERGGPDGGAV